MGRFSLLLVLLPVLVACGGAEGHYTLDKELTGAGMSRMADQEITKAFTQMYGENAHIPDDVRKEAKKEIQTALAQLDMDLHLEPGGTFRGSVRMETEKETMEGTWKLNDDRLMITTTRENGKDLGSPTSATLRYQDGRLSFDDPEAKHPFLVLSRQ